jgi:hypothetical protein
MTPAIIRSLLIPALLTVHAARVSAITVTGSIATDGGAPLAGATVTIEQVGGENPPWIATTAADGSYAVSSPLLFGNVRITVAKPGFSFSPASREHFTDVNLSGQNFSAASVGEIAVLALTGAETSLVSPAVHALPAVRGSGESLLTFRLRNEGQGPLTDITVSLEGGQAEDFTVLSPPPATLAAGITHEFQVRGVRQLLGTSTAVMKITSSDSNENPFEITLSLSAVITVVTNAADDGPGSLRAAFMAAAAIPGPDVITLDPSLSGTVILLKSTIATSETDGVTVDATTLPGGLTLSRDPAGVHRLLMVLPAAAMVLRGLKLTGDGQTVTAEDGGAILNSGLLELDRCVLTGHRAARRGGAIASSGRLTLRHCTIADNSAGLRGGGLYDDNNSLGLLTLTNCTFTRNTAIEGGGVATRRGGTLTNCTIAGNSAENGGGVFAGDNMRLTHCTVANNTASSGGGVFCQRLIFMTNCLVAGNADNPLVADVDSFTMTGFVLQDGANFVGSGPVPGLEANPQLYSGDARLAPFGHYGGMTQTVALRRDSPAIDRAVPGNFAVSPATDQRGFSRSNGPAPDLGAYESGLGHTHFESFIGETLPGTALAEHYAPDFDFDADGQSNRAEFLALTDPADPLSRLEPDVSFVSGVMIFLFPSVTGRNYLLLRSATLEPGSWAVTPGTGVQAGDGGRLFYAVPVTGNRAFFQVVPSLP